MEITRLFEILDRFKKVNPREIALGGKQDELWQTYSSKEYIDKATSISYGLMHLGIQPGDKIISITTNRPEFNFLDMGVMMCGAIHVPVYPNISNDDYKYILNHSEAKMIFVAGEEMYRRIKHILPDCPNIEKVYTFRNLHGVEHLRELINIGKENPKEKELQVVKDSISTDDVATMIYTSGTTGQPKGVMLSHANLLSNVDASRFIPPQTPNYTALSFLPLCHVYERMLNYMFQYNGYSIYYVENVATIADAMREIKPNIISTVPRLLESIFDKIMTTGRKLKGIKRLIFFWSINLGFKYKSQGNNAWYYFRLWFARKLVFSKWHSALGGNLGIIVSGGAALQPRLASIFWAAGFFVLEGYGLTETSPVIAVNNWGKNEVEFGTVGPVLKNVEIRIAEDGEIQVNGPNVMKGYYKEPEMTKEVMTDDGWFKTGDIGRITKYGNLKITDRKKEIFKTVSGKYIAPQLIENKLKESSFIENVMVMGENQKYAAAIISPNFFYIKNWCKVKGEVFSSNSDAIKSQRIRDRIAKELKDVNAQLGEHERIVKFELTDQAWSVDSGELTPTLKLKRAIISSKYVTLIDKLF